MIADGSRVRFKSEAEGGPKGDSGLECVYEVRKVTRYQPELTELAFVDMTSIGKTKPIFHAFLHHLKEAP